VPAFHFFIRAGACRSTRRSISISCFKLPAISALFCLEWDLRRIVGSDTPNAGVSSAAVCAGRSRPRDSVWKSGCARQRLLLEDVQSKINDPSRSIQLVPLPLAARTRSFRRRREKVLNYNIGDCKTIQADDSGSALSGVFSLSRVQLHITRRLSDYGRPTGAKRRLR
jgi:hypothetical protein